MAGKKFEKGSEEWQFFMDYYQFRQKYYYADNCDEWYQEMMQAGESIIDKYSGMEFSEYAKELIFDHFADVERRMRARDEAQK